DGEIYRFALTSGHGEVLIRDDVLEPSIDRIAGRCIVQKQFYLAGDFFTCHVNDLGAEIHLVPFAKEARRVRLHHQIFLCNDLLCAKTKSQILCMCECLELPTCERLRHREGKFDCTAAVNAEIGEE